MNQMRLKIIVCFLILFILDTRPFVIFYLDLDFLLLGIIFFSLRFDSLFLIFTSAIFGMGKDLLLFNDFPFFAILFAATVILIYFFKRKNIFWAVSIIFVLTLNFLVQSLFFAQFSWLLFFRFLTESSLIFLVINYFLGPLFVSKEIRA